MRKSFRIEPCLNRAIISSLIRASKYMRTNYSTYEGQMTPLYEKIFIQLDNLLQFVGEDSPLEENALDFVPQSSDAPAVKVSQFGVALTLERVVLRQYLQQMTPSQLSRQCLDNVA